MNISIKEIMRSFVEEAYERGFFSGCVLFAHKDDILFETALGTANIQKEKALNPDSIFELASVSKQFTAAAIILLRDRGALSLNDGLEKYFPGVPYKGRTVKNLLNHTAGIPDYTDWVVKRAEQMGTIPRNDIIERFLYESNLPEVFAAGTKWSYSNTGYAMLALIIEKVSGMSFGVFLEKEMFAPAEMSSTCVYHRRMNGETIENYAYGYILENSGYILPDVSQNSKEVIPLDGIEGDGIINSNLHDMLRWSLALRDGKIISHASQQEMYAPTVYGDGKTEPYGYGWKIAKSEKAGRIVHHSGGWPGYSTQFIRYIDIDIDMTLVLLMNRTGGDVWGRQTFIEGLRAIAEGRILHTITSTEELIDHNPDKSKYPVLCGKYEDDILVYLQDNRLFASVYMREQTHTLELLPAKDGRFITQAGISAKLDGAMICINDGWRETIHKKLAE